MPYQANGIWYNDLGEPIANGQGGTAGLDNPGAQAGFADPNLFSTQTNISAGAVGTQRSPEYWKTHKATTTEEASQKLQAYWAATNAGVKGQPYLDSSELGMLGPADTSTASDLSTVGIGAASGAGIGNGFAPGIGGAVGGIIGGVGGAVVSAVNRPDAVKPGSPEAIKLAGNYSAADFGGGMSNPTLPAGSGGGYPAAGAGGSMPNYAPQTGATGNPYLDAILAQTAQTTQANQGIIQNTVLPEVKNQKDVNSQVGQGLGANLQTENGLISGYVDKNNQIDAEGRSAASAAVAANSGYLTSYQDTLNGMKQLDPTAYQGDWTSNAGDVARQQGSYDTLAGTGSGALNYSAAQAGLTQAGLSQAQLTQAGYQTAAQYQNALTQAAALQLADYHTSALEQAQYKGVNNGENSPEAYRAQIDALGQMKALTNPTRTAQEEFLYEQQRQQEEQQQRSSRAGVMHDLRERGMSGSGMELTDQLGSDQITSQNRLLGDLGTQASALARSQDALANYGNLSSTMVGQGNQVGEFNANAFNQNEQFNTGQANDVNMFNANAYNTNSYLNAQETNNQNRFNADSYNHAQIVNATNNMNNNQFNALQYNQNQQFNAGNANQMSEFNAGESNSQSRFNAGQANQTSQFNAGQTNMASANNQSTQLSGQIAAGNQAASMRSASDAVGMANKEQQGISNRANDNFRATQQVDATNRATDLLTAGQGTTQTNLGDTTNALNASGVLNDKSFGAGQQGIQDTSSYWKTMSGLGQQNVDNAMGYGTLATGVNTSGNASASDALSKAAGDFAARQANGMLGQNIYAPYTYKPPGT